MRSERDTKNYRVWKRRFDITVDRLVEAGIRIMELEVLLKDNGVQVTPWAGRKRRYKNFPRVFKVKSCVQGKVRSLR
jgi:hypothetical protein